MDEETWLTAKEAKKLGLIDNITKNSRVAAAATSTILGGDKLMSRYRNEDPQPQKQEDVSVDDVMTLLEEIKSDVKAIRQAVDKKEDDPQKQTENKPVENSFARLFNMNIK